MYRTLLTCLLTTLCCAAEPTTQPATSRPASQPALTIQRRAELQKWIAQLGDTSYAVRESATGQLKKASDAIPLLVKAYAATKDAEVIVRIESIARRLFFDVIANEKQPGFLGIQPQIVTEVDVEQIPKDCVGVKIVSVVTDAPATKAGLKADDVIVRFDGKTLPADTLLAQFTEQVMAKEAGATVELQIARKGKLLKVKVTLAARLEFVPEEAPEEDNLKFQLWWKQTFPRPAQ